MEKKNPHLLVRYLYWNENDLFILHTEIFIKEAGNGTFYLNTSS